MRLWNLNAEKAPSASAGALPNDPPGTPARAGVQRPSGGDGRWLAGTRARAGLGQKANEKEPRGMARIQGRGVLPAGSGCSDGEWARAARR